MDTDISADTNKLPTPKRVYPSMHPDPEWRLCEGAFNRWEGTLHDDGGDEVADLTYLAGRDFSAAWQLALQFTGSFWAVSSALDRSGDTAGMLDAALADMVDSIDASEEGQRDGTPA
jgi:hypothetical protein